VRTILTAPKLSLRQNHDLKIIGVALSYYLAARLGYYFAFENTTSLPTWPPSGVAFALTLLFGRSIWPGIMIGSLVANVFAFWNNPGLAPSTVIFISSGIAIANTVEAVMGSVLLQVTVKDPYPFNSAKNAFRFLLVTMIMCLAGAGIGSWVLMANQIFSDDLYYKAALSSWVGNAVGIFLFTPFILSLAQPPSLKLTWEKVGEIGVFIVCGILIFLLLRIEYVALTFQHALPFLVLPFLLWIAFRFNLTLATAGVIVTSLIAIYATVNHYGPFILNDSYNTMLLLQIFVGVISVSTIVLSATVTERRVAQKQLIDLTATLETKVLERTRALKEEIQMRKEVERKIKKTNDELSKRNTELDNFVYSVSHDLRAPIASVLGLINLAKQDKNAKMKNTYLDLINKSALQQDHFIREILDQSRNTRLEVNREQVFFSDIISEAFEQLKFAAQEAGTVEKIVQIDQPNVFYSDRWRLKVILNNLLSNAIRYRNGKDPVIKISVQMIDHSAHLVVEDNGKGIEKEHLPNLCKMFYRATDDNAGSGLGLYIVKEAIDKLNGSLSIESEVHVGTRVKLTIPEIPALP
jgi:signal transduction histidine kinase